MPFSFNLVAKCGCLLIFMPFSFDLVANGGCLRFDYHMYGTTINTLNVNVSTVENGTQRLWWRHGNQGNVWSNATVPLPRSSSLRVSKLGDSVWWRFYSSSDHGGSNNFSVNDHKFMTSIQLSICLSIWSLDFVTNFSQFHLPWIYWTNFNLSWHKHPLVKGFLKKSFGILFVLNIGWNFKTLCQKTVLLLKGLFHSTILIYWISTQNAK